jgi:hypothetical protein
MEVLGPDHSWVKGSPSVPLTWYSARCSMSCVCIEKEPSEHNLFWKLQASILTLPRPSISDPSSSFLSLSSQKPCIAVLKMHRLPQCLCLAHEILPPWDLPLCLHSVQVSVTLLKAAFPVNPGWSRGFSEIPQPLCLPSFFLLPCNSGLSAHSV